MKLEYGDHSIETDDLPEASLLALVKRGFNHIMGSEAAAKVNAAKKKADAADKPMTENEIDTATANARDAYITALLAGTVGTRSHGPKRRGLDKFIHDVAVEKLTVKAAEKGAKLPSGKGAAERIGKLVELWLSDEKRKAVVVEEAERRFAAQSEVDSDEIDFDFTGTED